MPDDKRSQWDAVYEAASLGFVFPVAIGLGFFIGRWLDGVFGIRPWLTVIFTVLGIAAAFVNLFRAGGSSDGNSGSSDSGTSA
jgi:F0F1-type ATP synthase assembly protein I